MKITSYKEALLYLDSFIKPVVFAKIRPEDAALKDPLDRMRKLLKLLDNPQDKFKSVLVGGTSGKGSTSYLIAHMLTTAGYKTGYTLSPHLQRVSERIQIGDKRKAISEKKQEKNNLSHITYHLLPIWDEEFVEVLNTVIPAVEKMQEENFEPSHFEILIAMAFVYFAKHTVDIAIVEVGLGGRYDATNTLDPLVAVLTNVSLDHTAILGNTVEKIATEKVGIVKTDKGLLMNDEGKKPIVVTGVKQPSVVEIVEERCREIGAELYRLHKDFDYIVNEEGQNGTHFDVIVKTEHKNDSFKNLFLSLAGEFQAENASLAIEAVLQLRQFGFTTSEADIRKALSTAFVPGRFEIIYRKRRTTQNKTQNNEESGVVPRDVQSDFTIVLDGAHNPEKMKALIKSLDKIYPSKNPTSKLCGTRFVFIISFKEGKDISEMLEEIVPVADAIIITQFHAETYYGGGGAVEISNIKNQIEKIYKRLRINDKGLMMTQGKRIKEKVFEAKNLEKALESAFDAADEHAVIVVTGSLYFVGETRDVLQLPT